MPPLFFFYLWVWLRRLFWRLRLRGVAGWLWNIPQAEACFWLVNTTV